MKTVMSRAEFIDGPLQGEVREFDREEPPPTQWCDSRGKTLLYLREENPFGDGEKWIYMLDWAHPKEDE